MPRKLFLLIASLVLIVFLAACAGGGGAVTPTEIAVIPTETLRPTFTPEPTATITPTPTPIPQVTVTPPASPIASPADHFNFYENAGKSYEGGVVDTAREAACYYMLFLKLQSRPLFADFIASMEEFHTRLVNGEEGGQYQKPSCVVGEFSGEQRAAFLTWTAPDGNQYLAGDFTPEKALNSIFTWLPGNHTEEINLGDGFDTPEIVFDENGYPYVVLTEKNGEGRYVLILDRYKLGDSIEDHLMQIDDNGNIGWEYNADTKMWEERLPSSVNDPRVIQERDEAIAKWQTVLDGITEGRYTFTTRKGTSNVNEAFYGSGLRDRTDEIKRKLPEAVANTIESILQTNFWGVATSFSELETAEGDKVLILNTMIKDDEDQWVSVPLQVAIQPAAQDGGSCWIVAGNGGIRGYQETIDIFEQRLKNGPVVVNYEWTYALRTDGQYSAEGMAKLVEFTTGMDERIPKKIQTMWVNWAREYPQNYPTEFAANPRLYQLTGLEWGIHIDTIQFYDISLKQ